MNRDKLGLMSSLLRVSPACILAFMKLWKIPHIPKPVYHCCSVITNCSLVSVLVTQDVCRIITRTCAYVILFAVIRAKVVGKKLLKDGPFGTMRYTVKQMKAS